MKNLFLILSLLFLAAIVHAQTAKDIFTPSDVKISWLGVDFSNVKLIGDFSEFGATGEKSNIQIRDKYFVVWNNLILDEPNKYDIKGMLRKDKLTNDIDMLMEVNSATPLENMESSNTPHYKTDEVKSFLSTYNTEGKEGIGLLFMAESLNKSAQEAYFHFIAINLQTKELLFHKRLRGKPSGFGFRNYWAGSIYSVIKDIKKTQYKVWKKQVN